MAPQASWPPDVPAESLEARIPQPGVLSQASSARNPQSGVLSKIPQPGFLSQESPARSPQPGFLSQESSARIPQPGVLSKDSSARIPQPGVSSQTVWGLTLESYYFSFFYIFFSVFSLCSAAMFGHHVREQCSGLSGSMFDWTLCSGSCSNVRDCSSFEFLCFEPNVRMFVEHVFGSHFGSECSKSNERASLKASCIF